MKSTILSLICLMAVGCNSISRLPGLDGAHETHNADALNPNDSYITGTTNKDYQSIYLVITNRVLTIEVMRPNENQWVELTHVDPPYNPYQLFTIPQEGLHFGDRAEKDSNGNIHFWTGTPAAPIGTKYRIHSVPK